MTEERELHMDYHMLAQTLKALADPKRLQIVHMLAREELCAQEILAAFSVSQPTLSHDLALLTASGLVRARPAGRRTYYTLDESALWAFQERLGGLLAGEEMREDSDAILY